MAEESDEDGRGGFISHFGLYLRAMARCGADTRPGQFLAELRRGSSVPAAMVTAGVPGARRFVSRTFAVFEGGDLWRSPRHSRSAGGPATGLFRRIVDALNEDAGGGLEDFRYYLRRHIGLDGDEHGPMAVRLVQSLCGDDEGRWEVAERAAVATLEARRNLWDAVCVALKGTRR